MDLKETYNKIAENWHRDHQTDTWWVEGTDTFISSLKNGDRVLDAGCGAGTKSNYLISKGLKVLGIDFSENLIEIAKKEVPRGEFLVMDINNINTLQEKFDGIFMQAVLLHIPRKEIKSILQKSISLLNDKGYLYVAVKEKIQGGVNEETKIKNSYGYNYQLFFSYFTKEEIEGYFKELHFNIVFSDVFQSGKTRWIQVIGKRV